MPLRSVKMNRFIFGFQRRVWCPKWTPLSSSCFMLTTAIAASLLTSAAAAALLGCRGHREVHRPGDLRHHSPGGCPQGPRWRQPRRSAGRGGGAADPGGAPPPPIGGKRTREVDPPEWVAPISIRVARTGFPQPPVPSTDRPA